MKRFFLYLLFAGAFLSSCTSFNTYDFRCEDMSEPLAIDSDKPHFSWKISSDKPDSQSAYQIQVASSRKALLCDKADLWDSGKVSSDEQVMVPYEGAALKSRDMCWWRVKVWNSKGSTKGWSEPNRFGIGIIDATMKGDYVGFGKESAFVGSKFNVDRPGKEALLHVNSLGYHKVFINGVCISNACLTPAVSQLDKRSLIVTYDVKDFIREGENSIVIWIGSGWYKKDTFEAEYDGALVKAELDLDGECALCTDASWKAAYSGYADSGSWLPDKMGGEIIDARVNSKYWDPAIDKVLVNDFYEWSAVDVADINIRAVPQMCPLCRVQETLEAVSVESVGQDKWLVDFGRVVNGMFDITLESMPSGHISKASFADWLHNDGTPDIKSSNEYVSSGNQDGDRFVNVFNHHVFRYVLLEDVPREPQADKLLAHRMRTDYADISTFECSDQDLCSIHDMVKYTCENLAFDGYMVDCANIERLGYGGDGNASTLSLQTMFDVAPLYVNWLEAWNDCIHEDGGLPHTAPCPYRAGGGPYWLTFIVQAPWRTYMSYGDSRLLERCYANMKHWLDFVDKYYVDGLIKEYPVEDYRYWYLGDWLAPAGVNVSDPQTMDLVNNCALCQTYNELIRIADILGCPEDKKEFVSRLGALSERITQTFYHPETGLWGTGSQLDMAYPLLVGIVPEESVEAAVALLKMRTANEYNGHLGVGLVGVPVLTEWATLAGEADFMYSMLKQRDYPGYLYMIDNGATATWESWDARRSRMHNCYNGIASWFYQALGGIIPDKPGYRHIIIKPQLPQGVKWVHVTKVTPYGSVSVRSSVDDGLIVELPVGVSATINGREYGCGTHVFK